MAGFSDPCKIALVHPLFTPVPGTTWLVDDATGMGQVMASRPDICYVPGISQGHLGDVPEIYSIVLLMH